MKNDIVFSLDNIPCHIHLFGPANEGARMPLFIMPLAGESSDLIEGQHMRIDPLTQDNEARPHVLAVFETGDWDDDLSPWPAPGLGRNQPEFGGQAQKTLDFIIRRLIPAVESRVPPVIGGCRGLIGYSMAGLFALWAAHQTDVFGVYASCSGSLWYAGFAEYFTSRPIMGDCCVYLSLGDREEHTKHPMFSQVGNATRKIAEYLNHQQAVKSSAMVWHPGGHTGTVGERLAKAQIWMKEHA